VKDYHINIFWSDEDNSYVADIPDLKYCSAFGRTPQEALAEVLMAKDAWLEVAREAGKRIPEPRYRPLIYQVAGGAMTRFVCCLVATLWLVVAACGPTAAGRPPAPAAAPAASAAALPPATQALVEAARAEGSLSLVWGEGSVGGSETQQVLAAGFARYYGLSLPVAFTPGPSMSNVVQRLLQEYQAGRPALSDVVLGYGNHMAALTQAGALEAVDWQSWAPAIQDPALLAGGGVAVPIQSSVSGITYNSARLRPDEVPHGLQDLLTPQYKGRIAGQNAVAGFDQLSMPDMWGEQRVRDYIAQFAEQAAGVLRCNEKQRLASGEFDIFALDCSHGETLLLKQEGAPLDFAIASDAPLLKPIYMAVPKRATHPTAAKLWINYMLTREAQDTIYAARRMDNHRLPGSHTAADIERLQAGVTRFYEGDLEFFLRNDESQFEPLRADLIRLLKKS
jgi:ABC-type Fe3+ transport system substrate-binding protein/predicted RNase H-like HicB family nuclease